MASPQQLFFGPTHRVRFANGFSLELVERGDSDQLVAALAVRAGSADERWIDRLSRQPLAVPAGTAHFLEHMLFEHAANNVDARFHQIGAECSAYTTQTATYYYCISSEPTTACVQLLLEQVLSPLLDAGRVDQERQIILQELEMLRDNPDWACHTELLAALFPDHPLGANLIGTAESLAQIDVAALQRFYDTFYGLAQMTLVVVGGLKRDELIRAIEPFLASSRPPAPLAAPLPVRPGSAARRSLTMEGSAARVRLGFKVPPELRSASPAHAGLLAEVALEAAFGPGSAMAEMFNQRNLLASQLEFGYNPCGAATFVDLGAVTPEPAGFEQCLIEQLAGRALAAITPGQVEQARRKVVGRLLMSLDDAEVLAFTLAGSSARQIALEQLPAAAITLAECQAWFGAVLNPQCYAYSQVLPD